MACMHLPTLTHARPTLATLQAVKNPTQPVVPFHPDPVLTDYLKWQPELALAQSKIICMMLCLLFSLTMLDALLSPANP